MRFVFTPPADHAAGLLTLPWSEPLAEWQDERLVEIRQRGISRHVVRFVYDDGTLYALKELSERLARREYRLLRALAELSIPAVEVVGIAVDLGEATPGRIDATRSWSPSSSAYATTYRAVFSNPRGLQATDGLLDALAELLVRLHLSGFFWGDCSLSNTLFRYDAGTLEAYLVDAETSEQHPALTDGQRHWDVELAIERVYGELLDLQAGEMLPADVEPMEIAEELGRRYESLVAGADPRGDPAPRRAAVPDRRAPAPAQRARLRRRRGRADQHRRGEQAAAEDAGRGIRARLEEAVPADRDRRRGEPGAPAAQRHGRVPGLAGAEAGPAGVGGGGGQPVARGGLRPGDRRDPRGPARPAAPAEIFHEVLEHRWYMSEAAGRDVGTTAAARDYFEQVLPAVPEPLEADDSPGDSELLEPLDEGLLADGDFAAEEQ